MTPLLPLTIMVCRQMLRERYISSAQRDVATRHDAKICREAASLIISLLIARYACGIRC